MASLEEIRKTRLEKLNRLKETGMDPYPISTSIQMTLAEAEKNFNSLESSKKEVTVGGRMMSSRSQGALSFVDLYDGTVKFQALLSKDKTDQFDLFLETSDIGDFIEVNGFLFTTSRGQHTVEVKSWRMLSKSLRPLPEKWHGLQDVEERLRRRYLDILFNSEVKDLLLKKTIFWKAVRDFLIKEGFVEIETPVLEITTGGADAKPFKTHHNALDLEVYLRISAGELWQKELMVAGLPKTFEIGRIFRNEGISAEHLQDYTQMEFYWAYADYEKG